MCQNTGSYIRHLLAIAAVQAVQEAAHPSLAPIPGMQAHGAAPAWTLCAPWGHSPAPVGTREVQGQTRWAVSERKGPQKEKAEVQSTPVHGATGPLLCTQNSFLLPKSPGEGISLLGIGSQAVKMFPS